MNTNYLRLKEFSPAVGAGNNDYVRNATPPITTDAADAARIQEVTVDLGAYESMFATPTPQTLTFTSAATRVAGRTITLAATASSGLTPVTFAITSETLPDGSAVTTAGDVATLAVDGTLTLVRAGTVVITATQAGGNSGGTTYAAVTQTQTITVRDPAIPAIFRVAPTATGTMNGSSWANAMTLQAALVAAIVAGDQVWIAQGTYKPHLTRRVASFGIPSGVLVYGGFAGDEAALADRAGAATILSGDLAGDDGDDPAAPGYADTRDDNSNTVVQIYGPNVTLDGLTITAGDGRGFRGGGFGGGLAAEFGTTNSVIRNCRFTNNSTLLRGGGAFFETPTTLINCVFEGNSTTGNEPGTGGGGAYFFAAPTLTNCVFANNTAADNGGGVLLMAGATIVNATFYNNRTTSSGGAIAVGTNNPFTLQNSILVGNAAADAASGHQVRVNNSNAAHVITLQNNLIEGGADPMGTDQGVTYQTPGSGNITQTDTVDEDDTAVVFASTTAGEANYLRLVDGSPAVNAGNDTYIPAGITTDAAEAMRIQGGTVDLGAYESALAPTAPTIALSGTGITGDATPGYTVEAGIAESMLTVDVMPTNATGWIVTETTDNDNIITLAPLMGAVDVDAVITIAANTTPSTRTATLTFTTTGGTGTAATATLTITQEAVIPPSIALSGTGITAPVSPSTDHTATVVATAGTLTVTVDTGGDGVTGWTVAETEDTDGIITLPSPPNGADGSDAVIIITDNTSTTGTRTATLTFTTTTGTTGTTAMTTLVITQAAAIPAPVIALSGTGITGDATAGYMVDAGTAESMLTVDVMPTNATGWAVTTTTDTDGIITLPSTPSGAADVDAVITIAANMTPSTRTATLTFTTTGGTGTAATATLTITQAAVIPPSIALNGTGITAPVSPSTEHTATVVATAGTLTVTVDTGGDGVTGWTVAETEDTDGIITLPSPPNGADGSDAVIIITDNTSTTGTRTATLTFTTTTGTTGTTAMTTLIITQAAAVPPTIALSGTAIMGDASTGYTVTVKATGGTFDVLADIGGDSREWTVTETTDNDNIITLPNPATVTGDGTAQITITTNADEANTRTATLTFTTDGTPAATTTLTITQEAAPADPTIALSGTAIIGDASTGYTVTVESSGETLDVLVGVAGGGANGWGVTETTDNDGIIMLPSTTTGPIDGTASITIATNMTLSERTATLTFTTTGGTGTAATTTLTITQKAAPSIALSGTAIMGDASAGYTASVGGAENMLDVMVDIENATEWTVTNTDGFITLPDPPTIMDDGTAQITISDNPSTTDMRTAMLTFTTNGTPAAVVTLVITQAAAIPAPVIALSGTGITGDASAGYTVEAGAAESMLTVDVMPTDATGWTVTTTTDTDNIITLAPLMGAADVDAVITIAANTTTSTRTATLTFTTTGGTGTAATATLTITQQAAAATPDPPSITLSGTGIMGDASAGYTVEAEAAESMLTVDVMPTDATGWTVTTTTDTDGIITLAPLMGAADVDAVITIAANTTTSTRTVTLTFTTTGGTGTAATATLVITQQAATATPDPPSIALSGTGIMGDASAGYTVDTGAAESMLTVDVMPTDATGWAVTTTTDTDGIITLAPLMGAADIDAVITIAANMTTATRTATLTFTTTGGTGTAATATLTITQQAAVVLGFEEDASEFTLYPNPTSGKLHFSEQVAEFRLYGIEGRLLETGKNVRSADLSARPSGLYFVEVVRDGRSVRWRVVRE